MRITSLAIALRLRRSLCLVFDQPRVPPQVVARHPVAVQALREDLATSLAGRPRGPARANTDSRVDGSSHALAVVCSAVRGFEGSLPPCVAPRRDPDVPGAESALRAASPATVAATIRGSCELGMWGGVKTCKRRGATPGAGRAAS